MERSRPAQRQTTRNFPKLSPAIELTTSVSQTTPVRSPKRRVVADRPEHGDRKQERQDDVERAHGGERLARVVGRVLVLGRERRPGLRPVGRPAEDVQPDHDHHELVEPRRRVAVELDVRRDEVRVDLVVREVAGEEGADRDHEDRDHHQGPDDVAEPDGGPHAADVEDPAEHDAHDADQLRPAERHDQRRIPGRCGEVAVASKLGDRAGTRSGSRRSPARSTRRTSSRRPRSARRTRSAYASPPVRRPTGPLACPGTSRRARSRCRPGARR